jgi:hypothetical protein
MESSKEIFYNSYLKKLKRPELQREYNPDESYGANTLFRSENTNPWAGRDQDNAKYGALGGPSGYKAQIPGFSLSQGSTSGGFGGSAYTLGDVQSHGAGAVNLPFIQKQGGGSPLVGIAQPLVNVGAKYGANAIMDWMKGTPADALQETFDKGGGYEKLYDAMTSKSTDALQSAVSGSEAGLESGVGAAADAAGSASAAIPVIGAGLKLGTGALTGKLQRKPGSTIGSAAGGAIGATVGSVVPVIGTAIGGVAGSLIGDKIGTFADEGFNMRSISNALKPPDLNPMNMIKGIFGIGDKVPLKSIEEMNALLKSNSSLGSLGGEEAKMSTMLDVLNGSGQLSGDLSSSDLWDLFSGWQDLGW